MSSYLKQIKQINVNKLNKAQNEHPNKDALEIGIDFWIILVDNFKIKINYIFFILFSNLEERLLSNHTASKCIYWF